MTIEAKIIADSIGPNGKRITTFELEYPRFIHSELMTHRVFSRNAASSRAIPVWRSIELANEHMAMPIHWGRDQPGMSAREECNELFEEHMPYLSEDGKEVIFGLDGNVLTYPVFLTREQMWGRARDAAVEIATRFKENKYHKQIVNRLLEPFTHIKLIVTSTEYDNWFWLRHHADAQPEIYALAEAMENAYANALHGPHQLLVGQWHVPYYMEGVWVPENSISKSVEHHLIPPVESLVDRYGHTLQEALAISSSCCAQVSYRKLDDSLEKANNVYQRLVASMPPHFSPFEHQAHAVDSSVDFNTQGITHLDKRGNYWSGNFQGWVQHRQLIMDKLEIQSMTSKPKEL